MALRYGFFNSKNGDRKYDAIDISSIFDGIIEDGVFGTIGEQFTVTPGEGLQVIVGSGKAWFHHTWTSNDAPIPLSISGPDITLDRYDAVVLEINNDESVRANSIKIIEGKSQSQPAKPSLVNTENVHQYALAYVLVQHGSSSISSGDIEIVVGKSGCPFVTAPLESVSVDQLFLQWEHEFDEWFDNVQSQLEGDIATNLQRQIDSINTKEQTSGVYYEKRSPYTKLLNYEGEELPMPDGWQVGDVLNTLRGEIDDKWALCNGALVANNGDYDAYAAINNAAMSRINLGNVSFQDALNPVSADTSYRTMLQRANGMLFLLSDTPSGYKIFYSSDGVSWSSSDLPSGIFTQSNIGAFRIAYVKGKYYLYSPYYSKIGTETTTTFAILESSDLTQWSEKNISVDQTAVSGSPLNYTRYLHYMFELSGKVVFLFFPNTGRNYFPKAAVADSVGSTAYIKKSKISPQSIDVDSYSIRFGVECNVLCLVDGSYFYLLVTSETQNTTVVYKCGLNGYDTTSESFKMTDESSTKFSFLKVGAYYLASISSGTWITTDFVSWTRIDFRSQYYISARMTVNGKEQDVLFSVDRYDAAGSNDYVHATIFDGVNIREETIVLVSDLMKKQSSDAISIFIYGLFVSGGKICYLSQIRTNSGWETGIKRASFDLPIGGVKIPEIASNGANYFVKIKE